MNILNGIENSDIIMTISVSLILIIASSTAYFLVRNNVEDQYDFVRHLRGYSQSTIILENIESYIVIRGFGNAILQAYLARLHWLNRHEVKRERTPKTKHQYSIK